MKAGIGATAKGKDNEKDDYDDLQNHNLQAQMARSGRKTEMPKG